MIRATAILIVVWFVSRLLRNRSASERHLLWLSAMAIASLMPILKLIVPSWSPSIATKLAAALPSIVGAVTPGPAGEASGTIVHAVGIETTIPVSMTLLAIWAAGVLVQLIVMLRGLRSVVRTVAEAESLDETAGGTGWSLHSRQLSQAFGIRRKVRLLRCGQDVLPLTWGVFRPEILLPPDVAQWPEDRQFSVLAHEMAHIRRKDWLCHIFAEVVCAVYWFHPLFRLGRRQLRLEGERAADDAVLSLGVDGKDYARHLVDVARLSRRRRVSWSLAMAGQPDLEKRLISILNVGPNRRALTLSTTLAIVLPLTFVVLPVAAMRLPEISRVRTARTGDVTLSPPEVVRYTMPPLYSNEARVNGIEGVVTVEGRVDRNGQAHDLRVVSGLGHGLDENALLAVRSWKFTAGGDTAETSTVRVDVDFDLRNAELNDMIANDMVTLVGPGVVPPRILHRVEAQYPADFRRSTASTASSAVLLDAVIEENGVPHVVRVLRSVSWELDEAAISALERWRFSPAEKDGAPVKVRMDVEMVFVPPING